VDGDDGSSLSWEDNENEKREKSCSLFSVHDDDDVILFSMTSGSRNPPIKSFDSSCHGTKTDDITACFEEQQMTTFLMLFRLAHHRHDSQHNYHRQV